MMKAKRGRGQPRKHPIDDPLVTTKHRRSTLAMLKQINNVFVAIHGREWTRDDTLRSLAAQAGFEQFVPPAGAESQHG